MKKILLAALVIITTAAVIFVLSNSSTSKKAKEITTYSKKRAGVLQYKTTKKELKQAKIQLEPEKVEHTTRELFPKNAKIDVSELQYMNSISDDWKDKLSKSLLRFQKLNTKVVVRPYKSMIILKDKKGRYVEEVIISFINKNGLMNGFSAMVDSGSGKILKTWNRTTWLIKKQQGMEYQGELQ